VNLIEEVLEKNKNKAFLYLVGTKCDKDEKREVTYEEGEEFAKKYNFGFFETSAKANINVEEIFNTFAKDIVEGGKRGVILNKTKKENKSICRS